MSGIALLAYLLQPEDMDSTALTEFSMQGQVASSTNPPQTNILRAQLSKD